MLRCCDCLCGRWAWRHSQCQCLRVYRRSAREEKRKEVRWLRAVLSQWDGRAVSPCSGVPAPESRDSTSAHRDCPWPIALTPPPPPPSPKAPFPPFSMLHARQVVSQAPPPHPHQPTSADLARTIAVPLRHHLPNTLPVIQSINHSLSPASPAIVRNRSIVFPGAQHTIGTGGVRALSVPGGARCTPGHMMPHSTRPYSDSSVVRRIVTWHA